MVIRISHTGKKYAIMWERYRPGGRSVKKKKMRSVRLAAAGSLLGLTALIYGLAKYCPGAMFPWYQNVSWRALRCWGHLTDWLPFSLLEWSGLGLIWLALGWIIKVLSKRASIRGLLRTAALTASVILFLFVALWGADQFAPTFTGTTGYTQTEFTEDEAAEAAFYYLEMANEFASASPRDADGVTDFGAFAELAAQVDSGYEYLTDTYRGRFDILPVRPKGLVFSRLMDLCGLTGIFTAYTGEMGIDVNTPDVSLPFTISHECAHRTTVTQEADANFTAFLACIHSDSAAYRYSGFYSAFIYCYNAIAKVDRETQSRLWAGMNEQLRADVTGANAYYAQFDKPVKKVAQKANDGYLKQFNQPTGVNNYGAVAGPLMAYYWAELAPRRTA